MTVLKGFLFEAKTRQPLSSSHIDKFACLGDLRLVYISRYWEACQKPCKVHQPVCLSLSDTQRIVLSSLWEKWLSSLWANYWRAQWAHHTRHEYGLVEVEQTQKLYAKLELGIGLADKGCTMITTPCPGRKNATGNMLKGFWIFGRWRDSRDSFNCLQGGGGGSYQRFRRCENRTQ